MDWVAIGISCLSLAVSAYTVRLNISIARDRRRITETRP